MILIEWDRLASMVMKALVIFPPMLRFWYLFWRRSITCETSQLEARCSMIYPLMKKKTSISSSGKSVSTYLLYNAIEESSRDYQASSDLVALHNSMEWSRIYLILM